jgi:chemotaxis protein MotB
MYMFQRLSLLAFVGLALIVGTGCSNKTAEQRDSLNKQNADLASQLEAEKKARADAEARAQAAAGNATTPPEAVPGTPEMGATEINPPGGRSSSGASDLGGGVSHIKNKYGQDVIQISGDVLFASGKATLQPAAKKSLDKVAAMIKKDYNNQQLRVEGHTDPNPVKHSGWDDNWDLGAARARAVLLYLTEKGISKKNMYIASFADNDLKSTKNLALDRRVDIVVTNSGR